LLITIWVILNRQLISFYLCCCKVVGKHSVGGRGVDEDDINKSGVIMGFIDMMVGTPKKLNVYTGLVG